MRRFLVMGLGTGLIAALAVMALSRAATDSEEEALRALVPKVIASWETLDISKIEPNYAADADLAYFDLAPMKYNNWAEYRVGVQKAFFEPNRSIKLRLNDDLGVHRRGIALGRAMDHGPREASAWLDRCPRARFCTARWFMKKAQTNGI